MASDKYTAIPVKVKPNSKVVRHLFVKEHRAKEEVESRPSGKTLLVINIPPNVEEHQLQNAFKTFGDIDNLVIQSSLSDKPPATQKSKFFRDVKTVPVDSYRVAYIVFSDHVGVKNALSASRGEPVTLCTSNHKLRYVGGMRRWKQEYNKSIIDADALQQEIDVYMDAYDKTVEEEKNRQKELEGVPDEEGWIKVTSHGKRKLTPNSDVADKKLFAKEEKKRKSDSVVAGLPNFYTFQVKEGKMNRLTELRKKFDQDKKKIADMKATRKFKPF